MRRSTYTGFTVVELIIVIVVIAILASTTIMAYQGVQQRASDTAVKAAVRSWSELLMTYYAQNNSYPYVDDDMVCLGTSYAASGPFAANECAKDDDGWKVKVSSSFNNTIKNAMGSTPNAEFPTIKGSYYSGYDYFRGLAYYSMHDGNFETGFLYVLNGKQCMPGDTKNYTYGGGNVQCRHILAKP